MKADGCDHASLNSQQIPVSRIAQRLADISAGVWLLKMAKSGVEAEFRLEFRIATQRDLGGVEREFMRFAQARRLDTRAVEEFISATSPYGTAIGYCDGICAYLYGVLAKERSTATSLPHDAYIPKFNKAVEELADYNRPVARTISSLVEFHFNHFREATGLSPLSRVGRVAGRFASWIDSGRHTPVSQSAVEAGLSELERLVTDLETEQILLWGMSRLSALVSVADEIETFLSRDVPEFDRVKLRVLLGELHVLHGDSRKAVEHAKALRNVAGLEQWAESLLLRLSNRKEDHA